MSKLSKLLAAPLAAVLLVGGYAATSSASSAKNAELGVSLGGTDTSVVGEATVSLSQDEVMATSQAELKKLRGAMFDKNVKFDGKALQSVVAENGMNKQQYLDAVVWDSALEKVAVQRAFEQTIAKGHTRPDGSKSKTATLDGRDAGFEILASGTSMDVKGAIDLWASEEKDLAAAEGKWTSDTAHLHNLLNPKSRAQAFALVSGADRSFVAGQFYFDGNADAKPAGLNGDYKLSSVVSVNANEVTSVANSNLAVGESTKMVVSAGNLTLRVKEFASSAPEIAKVDSATGEVTGVAAGEATITATLADGTTTESTFTIGGTKSGDKDLGKATLTTTAGEGLKAGDGVGFSVKLDDQSITPTLKCEYAADGTTFEAVECDAKLKIAADGSKLRVTVAADGYQPKQLGHTFAFIEKVDASGTKTNEPKADAVPEAGATESAAPNAYVKPSAAQTSATQPVASESATQPSVETPAAEASETSAEETPSAALSESPAASPAESETSAVETEKVTEKNTESVAPSPTETSKVPEAKVVLNKSEIFPGESVMANGSGFVPGEKIEVEFHSTPVRLGTVTAEEDGTFVAEVKTPKAAQAGEHNIVFKAKDATLELPITVNAVTKASSTATPIAAPKGLPRTGGPVGVGIIAVVAVGACAIAFGARNAARRGDL
ncbi:Ig-like domain-containing protein [Propionimicrobium lymphophilum]|uniref:Ig-like domain-containing protein n=1 Tax=Propionimicrobium lymphophilum TaxID=33012 RepID=UPI003EC76862